MNELLEELNEITKNNQSVAAMLSETMDNLRIQTLPNESVVELMKRCGCNNNEINELEPIVKGNELNEIVLRFLLVKYENLRHDLEEKIMQIEEEYTKKLQRKNMDIQMLQTQNNDLNNKLTLCLEAMQKCIEYEHEDFAKI